MSTPDDQPATDTPVRARARREIPAAHGDEAELFARYHERLVRVTGLNVTASRDNVEDACAYAWAQLLSYQPRRDTIFAWLRTVARRQAIDLERASRRQLSINANEHAAAHVPSLHGAHRNADVAHGLVEVRDRLAVLPEDQRQIAFLRAAGWRYREIAQCLNVTEARVNKLLTRADARMRELDARDMAPHSERAARLKALEQDPPTFLIGAIGRPPRSGSRGGEELRREWRRLALAIDDYRSTYRVTHRCHALGSATDAAVKDRRDLEQRIRRFAQARGRSMDRAL